MLFDNVTGATTGPCVRYVHNGFPAVVMATTAAVADPTYTVSPTTTGCPCWMVPRPSAGVLRSGMRQAVLGNSVLALPAGCATASSWAVVAGRAAWTTGTQQQESVSATTAV